MVKTRVLQSSIDAYAPRDALERERERLDIACTTDSSIRSP